MSVNMISTAGFVTSTRRSVCCSAVNSALQLLTSAVPASLECRKTSGCVRPARLAHQQLQLFPLLPPHSPPCCSLHLHLLQQLLHLHLLQQPPLLLHRLGSMLRLPCLRPSCPWPRLMMSSHPTHWTAGFRWTTLACVVWCRQGRACCEESVWYRFGPRGHPRQSARTLTSPCLSR